VARRFGYRIEPHVPGGSPEEARRSKLFASQGVTVVLDVGANAGQYASRIREAGYGGRIVSFEPLFEAHAALEGIAATDPNWECRRLALGSEAGSAQINVAGNSWSSSLLEMGERHRRSAPESEYVATEKVPVARLDDIRDELMAADDRAWLKLDVQGFELEVLRGAEETLPQVVGLQAELSLVPLYEGAPLWREVVDHLSERGFRLAGFEQGFEDLETGETLQVDGVFVRDGSR
jgi:FkbM family methyltransferase